MFFSNIPTDEHWISWAEYVGLCRNGMRRIATEIDAECGKGQREREKSVKAKKPGVRKERKGNRKRMKKSNTKWSIDRAMAMILFGVVL